MEPKTGDLFCRECVPRSVGSSTVLSVRIAFARQATYLQSIRYTVCYYKFILMLYYDFTNKNLHFALTDVQLNLSQNNRGMRLWGQGSEVPEVANHCIGF